jgi:soluble lytic murein transglycosylase-like protein
MIGRQHVFGLVLLAVAAAPASADIYGFVDEEGRGHFSDTQVDARYKLYAKTKPAEAISPAQAAPDAAVATAARTVLPFRPTKAGQRYADMITKVAREQKIDPALLHAVVTVESAYNPRAKSPKGATGLMQVMPATGKRYGITNLLNPLDNLRAGARYLRDLLAMFDNNLRLVIAAYNAGEGAVMRSGNNVPNYPETKAYVPRVLQHYESYRQHYSES